MNRLEHPAIMFEDKTETPAVFPYPDHFSAKKTERDLKNRKDDVN